MKSLVTIMTCALLLFGIVACAGVDQKQATGDVGQKIADAYGIQAFDQIAQIRFEFNAEMDGKQVSRKWWWRPKTGEVIYQGPTSKLYATDYTRSEVGDDATGRLKKIDEWFVSDQRWFLFPLLLAREGLSEVAAAGRKFMPIGLGRAMEVVVTFPPAGGSKSGNVYKLYVDEDYRLKQWVAQPGEETGPVRISTWEDHRRLGPIAVAMERKGKGGKFRIWFQDVAVQLEGSKEWIAVE